MNSAMWTIALCVSTCFGASEQSTKLIQLIHGKLLVIPKEVPLEPGEGPVLPGMVRVWAYNKFSVHWSKAGYSDWDGGKVSQRFPARLPYEILKYLRENSPYVFEQNGKEFMLICANMGTRYDNRPFEEQVKRYGEHAMFAFLRR